MEALKICVARFRNDEVENDIDKVLKTIIQIAAIRGRNGDRIGTKVMLVLKQNR